MRWAVAWWPDVTPAEVGWGEQGGYTRVRGHMRRARGRISIAGGGAYAQGKGKHQHGELGRAWWGRGTNSVDSWGGGKHSMWQHGGRGQGAFNMT